MGRSSTDTLRIDPELRDLLGPLSPEEREQLRANIVADGGAIDPIIVWREQWVIVDGHNRYEICTDTGLPYKVRDKSFASRADVIAWMIEHQSGRRNMTPERLSYLRGKAYQSAKKDCEETLVPGAVHAKKSTPPKDGGIPKTSKNPTNPSVGQNDPPKKRTSEEVAKKTGVTEATVRRDDKYAAAVDRLANDVKLAVLDKAVKSTRDDVVALANLDWGDQRKIVKAVKAGEYKSIGAALDNGKATKPEAKDESESETGPVDGWGVPIQPHAAAAFEAAAEFDDMLREARKLSRRYAKLAEHPGGAYLLRPGISINGRDSYKHAGLVDFIHALEDCKPTYTVCPYAYYAQAFPEGNQQPHGKDCVLCHGLGWSRALGKSEADPKVIETIKEAFGV